MEQDPEIFRTVPAGDILMLIKMSAVSSAVNWAAVMTNKSALWLTQSLI